MKFTESWLREWVNPKVTLEKLADQLTMSGFEVEEITLAAKNDKTIELSITPNRGDCLSVRGVAREVSALTKTALKSIRIPTVKVKHKDKLRVQVEAKEACPHYVGRVIRNVDANRPTPDWMRDRLQAAGLNTISLIVDITNYVMLELGQPLHAFDLHTIQKEIVVRMAKKGEQIALLDGSTKTLNNKTLIIADSKKPLAIAGVMGGVDSSVTAKTQDIFLESAYFSEVQIAEQRQAYLIHTDSAYRFERGVDPLMQAEAIERATQLILEYAEGDVGPLVEVMQKSSMPKAKTINFSIEKLALILGVAISTREIENIFKLLQFKSKRSKNKWLVTVPSYRFDLAIEEDLVEEVARLYGYDRIAAQPLVSQLMVAKSDDAAKDTYSIRQQMVDLSYHEIVSYSFIDKEHQALLEPEHVPLTLANPITAEMSVMRTSLWPGLINAMLYNQSRQQSRIRLFEIGTCFHNHPKHTLQLPKMAGLITAQVAEEQWGMPKRQVDFFDIKGDVETLLAGAGLAHDVQFVEAVHSALHPGQTAAIYHGGKKIGILGALHPRILQALKITDDRIFVFEIDINELFSAKQPAIQDISKFPEIRRDIAILINQTIPAAKIQDTIREVVGTWLKDVFIFDVYAGKGIPESQRSIALAIIFQHPTRTLVDEEVVALMERVTTTLKKDLGADLRS